jgi:molecular chaperone GrpE
MAKSKPEDEAPLEEAQPEATAAAPASVPATPADSTDPEELLADLKRVQAEFLNYRRRAEAEKAEVTDFATTRIIREFLTVRDSFDQELAHRPATADPAWAKTIDAIRTQFDQVLSSLGAERFESKGRPFDPHSHDAIATEGGEGDQEVVVDEMQPGYKIGDRVIRHAVVKVANRPAELDK